MSFARFVLRSIGLSISVALRMALVTAVAGYAFYMIFSFLLNLPLPEKNLILVSVIVAIALFMPTVLFLYLSALRSGLVALRASGPPNFGTLAKSLFRLMRFNFMLLNLFITLFGAGLSVMYLAFFAPEFIQLIREGIEITSRAGVFSLIRTLKELPLVIVGFFALGVCLANGATGVSMAATAATAAVRAPGHDLMWGLGRWFGHLFGVSVIFLLAPVLYSIYALGGLDAKMGDLFEIPLSGVLAALAYLIWVGCFFAAAKSEAYVLTAQAVEQEHEEMMEALSGNFADDSAPDLRSILDQRLDAARTVRRSKTRLAEDKEEAGSVTVPTDIDGAVVDLRTRQESLEKPKPMNDSDSTELNTVAHVVPFPVPTADPAHDSSATGNQANPDTGENTFEAPFPHAEDVAKSSIKEVSLDNDEDISANPAEESSNIDSFDSDEWVRKFMTDGKTDTPSSG